MEVVVFNDVGDFAAMYAAERWCAERGISVGLAQQGAPRGLVRGDADIAKWRNLSRTERASLDGTMEGDGRCGPITIRLRDGWQGVAQDCAAASLPTSP